MAATVARWVMPDQLTAPGIVLAAAGPLGAAGTAPWNRLPRVKQIAGEYYQELKSHTSWGRLLLQFFFDPKLSLFSRMVREERAGRPMDDPSTPDLELTEPR